MISSLELVGYLGGVIVSLSLIPQIIKVLKTKSAKDISIIWTIIFIIGLILWVVYGLGIRSYPLIIMTSFETLMAISLLILKIRYG